MSSETEPLERLAAAPGAAQWVATAARRYVRIVAARDGVTPSFPPAVEAFLRRLDEIALGDESRTSSEIGTTRGTVLDVTGMKPAAVAADEVGCSDSYARRLVRRGRVRHHRSGPHGLLVDVDGLRRAMNRRDGQ